MLRLFKYLFGLRKWETSHRGGTRYGSVLAGSPTWFDEATNRLIEKLNKLEINQ